MHYLSNGVMNMIGRIAQRSLGLLKDETGVTMLEYTILLGIITVGAIASVAFAGTWVSGKWTGLTALLT